MKHGIRLLILFGTLAPTSIAFGQDAIVDDSMEKAVLGKEESAEKTEDGWKLRLKVGITGSLNDARNVVGAEPGTTLQIGGLVEGAADFKSGQHGWENVLTIQHAQTKTPQIERFVKSTDSLDLRSTYLYRFLDPDWLGLYGRFKLNTQVANGNAVRPQDTTVTRVDADGNTTTELVATQNAIRLTSAFEPLTLRETVGLFANPIEEKNVTLKTKLGGGSQQILSRGGFVIVAEPAPGQLTLSELSSFVDGGLEGEVEAFGYFVEDILLWNASANAFWPLVTSADTGLGVAEQINVDLKAGLAVKLQSWLSLEYLLNVKRVPLVINEWQVQNNLLLSASFAVL